MDEEVEVKAYDAPVKKQVHIEGLGMVTMRTSIEAEQDFHVYNRMLYSRRTPEITEEEIRDWKEMWEIVKDCDFEAIKKKYQIQFVREDDPWYDGEPSYDDTKLLEGWLGDPIHEENWQIQGDAGWPDKVVKSIFLGMQSHWF